MMRYLGTFLLLLCMSALASAQSLFIEDFNSTTATALTASGWTAFSGSGTNAITVRDTSGLTYSGYASSGIGNGVNMTNNGEDDYKAFTVRDSLGFIYAAAMINVSAAQSAGDYFFTMYSTQDGYFFRTFIKSTTGGYLIGISKNNTTPTYDNTVRSFGTTYLIVLKYDFNQAGSTDDRVGLWVNPSLDGSSALTIPDTVGQNQNDPPHFVINTIALRQGSAGNAPTLKIDGIRAGRTWNDVFYSSLVTRSSINFGTLNVGSSAVDSFYVKNTGTGSLTLGTIASTDPVIVVSPTSATIAAADSQWFHVTFTPAAVAASAVKLLVTPNGTTSSDTISVSGSGVQAGFAAVPTSLNFGNVFKDSTMVDTVTVNNASTSASLVIDSVRSSNALFTITPTSSTIGTSSLQKFAISFKPTAKEPDSANIIFYHNAPTHRDTVKVKGNGILIEPLFSANHVAINFGAILPGQTKTDSVIVTNVGYDSLFITGATSSDVNFVVTPSAIRLGIGGKQTFRVSFSPSTAGNKYAIFVFEDNTSEAKDTVWLQGKAVTPVSIAEIRKDLNGDLIADHSVTHDTLAAYGVVTTPNLQSIGSQTAIFIQDTSAGFEVFAYALPTTTYAIGDSVFVIGTVSQYHGLVEFLPLALNDIVDTSHFGIVKHNAKAPTPKRLTLHQLVTNAESYEGLLVEVDTLYKASGTWPLALSNGFVYVTNPSRVDTIQMFTSSSTNIAGSTEPSYPINVVGVVSQFSSSTTVYNNGYELEPFDTLKITKTKIAPTVTIAQARIDANSDLIADHSVTKDTLQIYGVITTPNLQSVGSQMAYFVQDATAGIEVFAYSLPPTTYAIGDSVSVVGTVSQYRGLVEFIPLTQDTLRFTILKHNAKKPTPQRLTLHQLVANAESYEGSLVEVDTLYYASGTWPAASSNGQIRLTNASKADTVLMFTSSSTNIAGSTARIYPINVVGVISQYSSAATVYNNGYELEPYDTTNIIHTPGTTDVQQDLSGVPATYVLYNSYPNPFNPSTTIQYGLPFQSKVNLKVYSVLGQEIATLVDDIQSASYHRVQWNGRDNNGVQVSSGVYFFRIVAQPLDAKASPFTQVRKMMLMK